MAQPLLTRREELRFVALARKQPESARELRVWIDRRKPEVIRLALADRRIANRFKQIRHRVLDAELYFEEAPRGQEEVVFADVGIYDYDRDVLVVAVVDLRRGTAVATQEHSRKQPPLTAEEREEARDIVLANPAFTSLKRYRNLEVTAFPARAAFFEGHPSYGHRCFRLYFWTIGARSRRVAAATVDLSARRLIEDVFLEGEE